MEPPSPAGGAQRRCPDTRRTLRRPCRTWACPPRLGQAFCQAPNARRRPLRSGCGAWPAPTLTGRPILLPASPICLPIRPRDTGAHVAAVSSILAHAPRGRNGPASRTIRQHKCRNCMSKYSADAIFGPHSTCGSGPPAHGPTATPRPGDARAWFALGAQCRAPAWAPEARQAAARQEF